MIIFIISKTKSFLIISKVHNYKTNNSINTINKITQIKILSKILTVNFSFSSKTKIFGETYNRKMMSISLDKITIKTHFNLIILIKIYKQISIILVKINNPTIKT